LPPHALQAMFYFGLRGLQRPFLGFPRAVDAAEDCMKFVDSEAMHRAVDDLMDQMQKQPVVARDQVEKILERFAAQVVSLQRKDRGTLASQVASLKESLQNARAEMKEAQNTWAQKEANVTNQLRYVEEVLANTRQELEEKVAQLRRQLGAAAKEFKRRIADVEARGSASASAESPESKGALDEAAGPGGGSTMRDFFAALKCPVRFAKGDSFTDKAPYLADPAYCREVAWRMLNVAPRTMALLCEVPSLKVLDATESAKATFHTDHIGMNVVSICAMPVGAALLRKATLLTFPGELLETKSQEKESTNEVPGLVVHTLGRLDLRGCHGSLFGAVVTIVYLPEEPLLGTAPTVAIVLNPVEAVASTRKVWAQKSAKRASWTGRVAGSSSSPGRSSNGNSIGESASAIGART